MDVVLSDPVAAEAVSLIDAGDAAHLEDHLVAHPGLLAEIIDIGPEAEGDGYFVGPRLLWFVAENPIRTGCLAPNIADIAELIAKRMRATAVPSLGQDLDTTLGLVASGRVARECGVQGKLIGRLAALGASPDSAMATALAHRETAAAEALITAGAATTLEAAAGLGHASEIDRLAAEAPPVELQHALSLAAVNGQAEATRRLLAAGADPNLLNDPGYHGHTTPLHQAVWHGALETVEALIAGGADAQIVDRSFGGTALGWAIHSGQTEVEAYLRRL